MLFAEISKKQLAGLASLLAQLNIEWFIFSADSLQLHNLDRM